MSTPATGQGLEPAIRMRGLDAPPPRTRVADMPVVQLAAALAQRAVLALLGSEAWNGWWGES